MKAIARILEVTGFCAAFVAFAYSLAHSIDPGSCKRVIIGPLGWAGPFVMLALVLGFGAAGRSEFSKRAKAAFWLFSSLFFAAQASLLHFHGYGSFDRKWQKVVAVFTPQLRLGDALEAVAAFYVDIVHYWMPFASAISFLAFVITLITKTGSRAKAATDRPLPDEPFSSPNSNDSW